MDDLDMGPMYLAIGQLVARDVRDDPEGALLVAEVEEGVTAASIFKDVGDRVLYREASLELFNKIHEVWTTLAPDKRWATMLYKIADGRFSASFQFPDEVDFEIDHMYRRDDILKERYRDKPVDFSDP